MSKDASSQQMPMVGGREKRASRLVAWEHACFWSRTSCNTAAANIREDEPTIGSWEKHDERGGAVLCPFRTDIKGRRLAPLTG